MAPGLRKMRETGFQAPSTSPSCRSIWQVCAIGIAPKGEWKPVAARIILEQLQFLPQVEKISNGADMEVGSARKTILVVDDDPDILDYASSVLEDCGYEVLT